MPLCLCLLRCTGPVPSTAVLHTGYPQSSTKLGPPSGTFLGCSQHQVPLHAYHATASCMRLLLLATSPIPAFSFIDSSVWLVCQSPFKHHHPLSAKHLHLRVVLAFRSSLLFFLSRSSFWFLFLFLDQDESYPCLLAWNSCTYDLVSYRFPPFSFGTLSSFFPLILFTSHAC